MRYSSKSISETLAGMKQLAVILLLFVMSKLSFSQTDVAKNVKRASRIQEMNSPRLLAEKLTSGVKTDREKVYVIFRWIADNISYRTRTIPARWNSASKYRHTEPDDADTILKPLDERVAEYVLEQRSAVCDGYTRLFKTLCDYAGVRSEIISGYARAGRNNAFQSNHNWNAVYLDSSWHLLDVTWASGYTSYFSNDFIKFYDEAYFLTPPESFIRDHYPEDLTWTLLSKPPVLREFESSPYKYGGFIKSGIRSFAPSKGVLEAFVGDTLQFEIESRDRLRNFFIVDTAFVDSTIYVPAILPDGEKQETSLRKLKCSYVVPDTPVEWLYLVFNDKVLLRYNINVQKRQELVTQRKD